MTVAKRRTPPSWWSALTESTRVRRWAGGGPETDPEHNRFGGVLVTGVATDHQVLADASMPQAGFFWFAQSAEATRLYVRLRGRSPTGSERRPLVRGIYELRGRVLCLRGPWMVFSKPDQSGSFPTTMSGRARSPATMLC